MKRHFLWSSFFILLILLTLSSCVSAKFLGPNWEPKRIAIMPFTNDTADVAVEKFARAIMYNQLTRYGFEVLDLETVDTKLDELGITEGGQLETVTIKEIAAEIHADSLLYGNIIEAKRVLLGVYFKKEFTANFKIYDTISEELKWEDERTSKESKFVINPVEIVKTAAEQFVVEVGTDAVFKLLGSHPLIEHIRIVVNTSAKTLPR
ncbi:DUF799 family lipoprotein [bacterium]|nr:DUF799 family lipoprotein [bacterium]